MISNLTKLLVLLLGSAATFASISDTDSEARRYWAQWRGPLGRGEALHADPPIEWSESKNVRWKIEIPGKGSASPIVWGETLFLQTAVPTGEPVEQAAPGAQPERPGQGRRGRRGPRGIQPTQVLKFVIFAINRTDGSIQWQRTLREELPHEGTHPTGTWASGSPVTDGKHVWAYFGSRGLYCLDMQGKLIWSKDLGDMRTRLGFGEGSSPALAGGRLFVNWDHEEQSFIVALDARDGREIWRRNRDEITSWTSPLVVEVGGKRQVVTSATNKIRSYDFESGELVWEASGMTLNAIPTPVTADGIAFLTSGFRGNALLAVDLAKARGDITGTEAVLWRHDRDTPYTPSPLLYQDTLYILKGNNGILTAFESASGKLLYGPVRLAEVPNIYASPVGAAGRVYIAGREGSVLVLEHGPEFKVIAVNHLDDGFDASPALVDKEIYLRGKRYLYRISN